MASLLIIAARIEAAVASFISVHPAPNEAEWRRQFRMEQVSALFYCYILIPI
jgi:hypothetical protein